MLSHPHDPKTDDDAETRTRLKNQTDGSGTTYALMCPPDQMFEALQKAGEALSRVVRLAGRFDLTATGWRVTIFGALEQESLDIVEEFLIRNLGKFLGGFVR